MSTPRQRLLDTAGRLFTERGFACVGINEIIAKAEVAKASFYQHFPSKQDLCAAWLQEEAALVARRHKEILDSRSSVRRKIAVQFDDLSCWAVGNCFRGCPFAVTAAMSDAGDPSRRIIEANAVESRQFWQKLARQVGLSGKKARDLGDAWLLLYTGALTQAQNTAEAWPIEQARRIALSLAKAATPVA